MTATPETASPSVSTWTEAPASVTVKVNYRAGWDLMLTIRGDSGSDILPKIDAALDWLIEHGGEPTMGHTMRSAPVPAKATNGNGHTGSDFASYAQADAAGAGAEVKSFDAVRITTAPRALPDGRITVAFWGRGKNFPSVTAILPPEKLAEELPGFVVGPGYVTDAGCNFRVYYTLGQLNSKGNPYWDYVRSEALA